MRLKVPIKFDIRIEFFIINNHTSFSSFNLCMIPNHKGWATMWTFRFSNNLKV